MNLKYVIPGVIASIAIITMIGIMSSEQLTFQQDNKSTESSVIQESQSDSSQPVSSVQPKPESQPAADEIMVTNGQKHLIPLDKIKGGGPPKDGIPSIDNPKFEASNESDLSDSETVIGLEINGDARAYPLSILVWHEIVNDDVGGIPVAVTYCPLCYTNQVFERRINGVESEFGTSGKLYNSNLVMYDRLTDSYWSQALGKAITGELTGHTLNIIPFDVITWGDWKKLHPDTVVLTTDTGHIRAYGVDPYGDYYTDPRIIFPVDNNDDRMHPKEVILGFHQGEVYKAYKQKDVESSIVINDQINDMPVLLVSLFEGNARAFDRTVDGEVMEFVFMDNKLIDTKTNSEWNYDGIAVSGQLDGTELNRLGFNPGFWFEWVAFHPQTQVYDEL